MVDAMQSVAQGDIEPPKHVRLRESDRPFWVAVVRARAKSEWTEADLVNAGNLARCMADIERLQSELDDEGDVVINAKGTAVPNPKHAILETLSRRVMALMRLMQMSARSSGHVENKVEKRKNEASARKLAESLEDDLIPMA